VKPVKKYLNACYLFDEKLPFKLELKAINEPVKVLDGTVEVRPIVNLHLMGNSEIIDATEYPNKMECYSYLLQMGSRKLLYTADIASIDEMEPYLDGLDLLITETTHIDTTLLPALIEKNQIARVILSHIGDDKAAEIIKFADSRAAAGKIVVGEDNLTIKVE
ncbi:MAG: MBL fold metallo-hydrolase, partial [Candidatus Zixiibacteriota bacterium]